MPSSSPPVGQSFSAFFSSGRFRSFHFSRGAGLLVLLLGVGVLLGWAAGHGDSMRLSEGFPKIMPMTAVLLSLQAIPLAVSQAGPNPFARSCCKRVFLTAAIVSGLAGGWVLLGYLFSFLPRIESLLFWETVSADGSLLYPGRPSPQTSVGVVLCALIIACLSSGNPLARRLADVVTVILLLATWAILFSYATLATPLISLGGSHSGPGTKAVSETGISAFTAFGFLMLGCGFAGLRRSEGFFEILGAATSGGMVVRMLLPLALLLPVFMGWLIFWHLEMGSEILRTTVVAIMAVVSLTFTTAVVVVGHLINKREQERREAEAKREEILNNLRLVTKDLESARKDLVTVCAWTNRVLDEGQWIRFEDYLYRKLGIQVSHGICEESMMNQMEQLGSYSLPKVHHETPLEKVRRRRAAATREAE